MDDWIIAGIGAWLGNRWFGAWLKRHPLMSWSLFGAGTIVAVAILIVLD